MSEVIDTIDFALMMLQSLETASVGCVLRYAMPRYLLFIMKSLSGVVFQESCIFPKKECDVRPSHVACCCVISK